MEAAKKTAIIIGAGPAGLTAALELLRQTDYIPVLLEAGNDIGGISKTVNYKGNRMDIGGHRFFSKSDKVMQWWLDLFPVEAGKEQEAITYHRQTRELPQNHAATNTQTDEVMLVRNRLSRIFYLRSFFPYPISLSISTLKKLGLIRTMRIGVSYVFIRLFPIRHEKNLEDFFINRFGKELYKTFFKDYTEKVWGISCTDISPEWGAQRIKGVSIGKAIAHALRFQSKKESTVSQKNTETSLIEKFLYPKFGPGQLWESVARRIIELGGSIHMNQPVERMQKEGHKIVSVTSKTGSIFTGEVFLSTMPVKDLINGMEPEVPTEIADIANGLQYRDFITVGLLLRKMKMTESGETRVRDNWIYIQESDVKVGRLQIFNNWSPHLVQDPDTTWLGMEYFCNEGDELWQLNDSQILELAKQELVKIGLTDASDVLDGTVVRMPKTYPAYFGTYKDFDKIREFTDTIENLYLIGRNGMHKYNNQDHSMLTAMQAVEHIKNGILSRDGIWEINTEMEYHEEK